MISWTRNSVKGIEMYSSEFKAKALRVLDQCDGSCAEAAQKLGVVCTRTLRRWRDEREKPPRKRYVHLSFAQKRKIAELVDQGKSASELADSFGVSITTVYNIRNESRLRGALSFMDSKEKIEVPPIDSDNLPDDIDELKRRCAKLELDNAILEQTIDILKKDPGVDPSELSNREKMMVIDALKGRFCVSALCGELGISRSSYYYARAAESRPDPHREVRARIRAIFVRSRETFGSERVWLALRNGDDGQEPIRVSEKVVRRIMAEEGLHVIYAKKRRGYSSYKGEISKHPGNRVNRVFHADAPDKLWLTDITQFTLPACKCYLSAIVDCFDGKVVSHVLSKRPDADLANMTLSKALDSTSACGTVLHSDCGCHYRWPGWIGICEEHGVVRSMSKKACSPDNAACEGFFGRLKNEFFYYRDWTGVGYDEFSRELSEFIEYYNGSRKKKSLGWLSPKEYRLSLGYTA